MAGDPPAADGTAPPLSHRRIESRLSVDAGCRSPRDCSNSQGRVGGGAATGIRLAVDEAPHAAAKAQVCAAFGTVRRGIARNTNLQIPARDAAAGIGAAATARIALCDGGQYLSTRWGPATSRELAHSVRGFANSLMDLDSVATVGAVDSDPDRTARLSGRNAANAEIGQLCA